MMSRAFALIKIVSIVILNNILCDENNVDLISEREVEQIFKLALDRAMRESVLRYGEPKKSNQDADRAMREAVIGPEINQDSEIQFTVVEAPKFKTDPYETFEYFDLDAMQRGPKKSNQDAIIGLVEPKPKQRESVMRFVEPKLAKQPKHWESITRPEEPKRNNQDSGIQFIVVEGPKFGEIGATSVDVMEHLYEITIT